MSRGHFTSLTLSGENKAIVAYMNNGFLVVEHPDPDLSATGEEEIWSTSTPSVPMLSLDEVRYGGYVVTTVIPSTHPASCDTDVLMLPDKSGGILVPYRLPTFFERLPFPRWLRDLVAASPAPILLFIVGRSLYARWVCKISLNWLTTKVKSRKSNNGGSESKKNKLQDQPILENGLLKLGKLSVNTKIVLGYGSSGTVVYEGSLSGRKVAVKRLVKEFYSTAEKETTMLIESDEHNNVIRYYATEEDGQFVYLALSYADGSLDALVELELSTEDQRSIIGQILSGVRHLHSLSIGKHHI